MQIVCLDLEGVLVPEIWINVAEKLGIEALKKTTRDIPDYDELMRYRLDLIAKHDITLSYIKEVIAELAFASPIQIMTVRNKWPYFGQIPALLCAWPLLRFQALAVTTAMTSSSSASKTPQP